MTDLGLRKLSPKLIYLNAQFIGHLIFKLMRCNEAKNRMQLALSKEKKAEVAKKRWADPKREGRVHIVNGPCKKGGQKGNRSW